VDLFCLDRPNADSCPEWDHAYTAVVRRRPSTPLSWVTIPIVTGFRVAIGIVPTKKRGRGGSVSQRVF
jgi:hypothetical protein